MPAQITTASAFTSDARLQACGHPGGVRPQRGDAAVHHQGSTLFGAGGGQADAEFMDVAGGVGRREKAAIQIFGYGRLDPGDLLRRHRIAFQAALAQQQIDLGGGIEAAFIAVNMHDPALFEVECDALGLGDGQQLFARRDGQARGGDGVAPVAANLGGEFGKPAIFMPARAGVQQQRCIGPEDPFHALDECGGAVPDLGIAGRKLAAIGKRGLHAGIALALDQGNAAAADKRRIGGGHTGDTGADDENMGHAAWNS
jgi:hypothetical protein